ncbi:hypothetical protein HQ590_08055 [bacterium]|nr:hypothetical protein [bacterium]
MLFLLASAALAADRPARFVTAVEIKPAADSNFVERVAVSNALTLAVSEPGRLVAVSHAPGSATHLSLFRLNDAGGVITSGPPVTITYPKPASLGFYTNFISSVLAHPTQPVLYVLQEVFGWQEPPMGDPQKNLVFKDLDRLFVYRIDPTNVTLAATVRGEVFMYGTCPDKARGGPLGLDAANGRLYLPSLRDVTVTGSVVTAIGYLDLDDQGLPVAKDGRPATPTIMPVPGQWIILGCGWGLVSRDTILFGLVGGFATWNQADRRAPLTVKVHGHPYEWCAQITTHPALPMLYRSTPYTVPAIAAFELVDGYPTLLPQEINVRSGRNPQVLAKRAQLAVGRPNELVLVKLDANGWFTGEVASIAVPGFGATAFCYVPGMDRLYVAGGAEP